MFELFRQMFRLPLDVFNASLDLMRKTWDESLRATGLAAQAATSAIAPAAAGWPTTTTTGSGARSQPAPQPRTTGREAWQMGSDDLGGNDLKYVRYAILFTKRDHEARLEEEEDLVNYPTNAGSYGGLKIAEFMEKVAQGQPRPQEWIDSHYPPGVATPTYHNIPREDRRYVSFVYRVERRVEREDADYEKRKVRALEEISRKIGP